MMTIKEIAEITNKMVENGYGDDYAAVGDGLNAYELIPVCIFTVLPRAFFDKSKKEKKDDTDI